MDNLLNYIRHNRYYNFKSLLFLSTSILTFICLSFTSYQFYSSTARLMIEKSEGVNTNTLYQLNKALESNLMQIERITKIVSGSSTLIEQIKLYEQSALANRIRIRTNIGTMLLKFQEFNSHISDIYVLSGQNVFHVGGPTTIFTSKDLPNIPVYPFLTENSLGDTPFFFEPNQIDFFKPGYNNLKQLGHEYFFGDLIKDNAIASGTVLVMLNNQIFGNLLNNNPNLLILNKENQTLWKGNEIKESNIEAARKLSETGGDSGAQRLQDQTERFYLMQSGFNQLKLVYIQKNSSITDRIALLKMYLILAYLIMIVLSLFFSYLLSKKIIKPIRRLLAAVDQYRNHDSDKPHHSYVKRFPRITLRENIMYFIIVITMVPIILFSLFSSYYANNVIEKYLFKINETTFEQISNNLDHYIENKEKVIYNIAYDTNIQDNLIGSPLAYPVDYLDLIDDYLMLDIGRDEIFIYNLDKTIVFTNTSIKSNTTVDKDMLEQIDVSRLTFAWLNTQKDEYGRYLINLIVKINDVSIFQPIGYIQCQISAFELENIYKMSVNSDSNYYIVNKYDNIISTLDPNKMNTDLRLDPSSNFIFKKQISETPWYIVGSYNYSNIREEMKQIANQQIYTIIIIFLIVICIAYVLSLRITSSLRKMNELLGKVSLDHMEIDFPPRLQIHEISELTYSFNEMVRRIESLIDDLLISAKKQVDLENKKKNAELIALQSQINPHFLYNTFDNINWLIKSGDKENSLQMVTALSNLLRYSSKSDRMIVTVSEEIQHIQSYMDIMRIRFSEQISLSFFINDSYMSYQMIKLTLQPIIENAIYHAIAPKQKGGRIKVKFYTKSDDLMIRVLDDGVGLRKEQVEELNRNLNKEGYPERIGLYNVQTRIRLTFGIMYGLRIWSRLGNGTIVEICLPKVLSTDNQSL